MPVDKYKQNVFYYFPKDTTVIDGKVSQTGTPFYGNREIVKRSVYNPQANTYKGTATEVIKTTSQLNFVEFGKVSKYKSPTQDQLSIIDENGVDKIPYLESGNKYRNKEYWEYTLTLQ